MKKTIIAIAAAFLVIIGALMWWFSDSQVVKRNTHSLANTLTIKENDTKSTRALKGQDFATLLESDFSGSIEIKSYSGHISRDDAVSGHQYMALSVKSSHVTVTDINITNIDVETATLTANFTVSVTNNDSSTRNDTTAAT